MPKHTRAQLHEITFPIKTEQQHPKHGASDMMRRALKGKQSKEFLKGQSGESQLQ